MFKEKGDNMTEKRKRINALRNMNPKLSFRDACKLLGYNPDDPDLQDDFSYIFPWMREGK